MFTGYPLYARHYWEKGLGMRRKKVNSVISGSGEPSFVERLQCTDTKCFTSVDLFNPPGPSVRQENINIPILSVRRLFHLSMAA